MSTWSIQDSASLYGIPSWGRDFVSVSQDGHLLVGPEGRGLAPVDLKHLVDDMQRRGIDLPILIRFPDVLAARVDGLATAFQDAIHDHGYTGMYRGVYPIKVNQQRHLVEHMVQTGRPHHMGLECGSKPELLVVMAMLDDPEALIICNGYKDEEYIETAILAGRLGMRTVIVIEKFSEIDLIIGISRRLGLRPRLGFRAKLASEGSGRWQASTGDRAKFGLTAGEMVSGFDKLASAGMTSCLQLLHFHIGSQVSAIRSFKEALREGGRIYAELVRMGAPMGFFDAGGGLGVDYDGSSTDLASSMNYSVQEYALDVVGAISGACDHHGIPHPDIVTESGRALVAHHAVLVVNVLGVSTPPTGGRVVAPSHDAPEVIHALYEALSRCSEEGYQAAWHDALSSRAQARDMFNLGLLDLRQRAEAERLYWQIVGRIARVIKNIPYVPDDVGRLRRSLADTYFCNFSLFQSMPDSWAVDQMFPIVPVQRLDEEPLRTAVLADITCDSDGKVDRFIGLHGARDSLPLHPIREGESYHLAAFLVGAYQEILGDLHNLFGDTNVVVVKLDGNGSYALEQVVEGDTVADVVRYVQYDRREMVSRLRQACERAVREGTLSLEESRLLMKNYIAGLEGYTYLE